MYAILPHATGKAWNVYIHDMKKLAGNSAHPGEKNAELDSNPALKCSGLRSGHVQLLMHNYVHVHCIRHVSTVYCVPVSPRLSVEVPSRNCRGSTPMPTRLERWIRSKLSAITAFTPYKIITQDSKLKSKAIYLLMNMH